MEFDDNYGCLSYEYFWEYEYLLTQEEMSRLIPIMIQNYLENKEGGIMSETEKTYTFTLDEIDFSLLYAIVSKADEYVGEDGIDKRLTRLKDEMYDALYSISEDELTS